MNAKIGVLWINQHAMQLHIQPHNIQETRTNAGWKLLLKIVVHQKATLQEIIIFFIQQLSVW